MARNDDMVDETGQTPGREARLARLAERQHGVVALRQLVMLGLSASAVRSRAATGRLHRVHRGVYAVGHRRLTRQGRYMAAVLACGPGAALSHRSSADLRGVRRTARARIDVTAPHRAGRRHRGVDVHSGATLRRGDVELVDGIPCTTLARTLLDLAEVVDRRALERAINEAEVLRVFDGRAVAEVLASARGRRGAAALRAALAAYDPAAERTRSELERRFLAACRAAGVPDPVPNMPLEVGGERMELDFAWPRHRLAIETDGWQAHGTRRAFEEDRRRDLRLLLAGWRVARLTRRQVQADPAGAAAAVTRLLQSTATDT